MKFGEIVSESLAGTASFDVTAEVVRRYAAAIGCEWQLSDEVPSTLSSVFTYAAVAVMPITAGVVLAGQSFDFHTPVAVGDALSTEYEVAERYEKRGREYMVIATSTTNQHGDLVVTGRITRLLPLAAAA